MIDTIDKEDSMLPSIYGLDEHVNFEIDSNDNDMNGDSNANASDSQNEIVLEIIDINEDGQETILNKESVTLPEDETQTQHVNETIMAEENNNILENVDTNTPTRKRKRNPNGWKQNIRKENRQHGKEYINTKGKLVAHKSVKTTGCKTEKCSFKCEEKITVIDRENINRKFWSLGDEIKNHFYSKHIRRYPAIRKRTKNENSRKTYSYDYFLYVSGVKIKVCQEFFLNTLNISKSRVYYFFQKVESPKSNVPRAPITGKHQKKVVPDEDKEKPKKDLCDKCEGFKVNRNASTEEKMEYEEHLKRKNIGRQERQRDREAYIDDDTLICGRAGVHIANAIIRILKRVIEDNPQLEKIILWSDSCVPQNRNSILSFALQYFLNSPESGNLRRIEQKFGEPGHGNVQEVDAAHSCIERFIKNLEIWSPLTLVRILLKIPNTWKLKFSVLQMKPADYKNYQLLSGTFNYNEIPYTKLKHIIYDKRSIFNVKFKTSFEGESSEVRLVPLKKYRNNNHVGIEFPTSIPNINLAVKINDVKRKHLLEMMDYMPEDERIFYKNLMPTEKTAANKQIMVKKTNKPSKGLETILKKYPDGQLVLIHKDKLNNDLKGKLTKIIISEFFGLFPINDIKPNIFMKVAKEIEEFFPLEKSDTYYLPYDPEHKKGPSGKLYTKFINTTSSLKLANASIQGKQKSKNDEKENSPLNKDDEINITFLKRATEPIGRIFESWEATFKLRRKLYLNASLQKIFEDFPCLKLNQGLDLIETDFNKRFPESVDAIYTNWEKVRPAIRLEIKVRKIRGFGLGDDIEDYKKI
ncbi:unnamed protein product [Ceutorhynchus assimilis]|uniref:Uncharacterized protein n=1 Tax=Ceutorhynchus assimilis TaxID=467358 RepID=A0A9N9MF40_9CUCU|nr:unnamed protein product [Ceutorhynchus assimilis]